MDSLEHQPQTLLVTTANPAMVPASVTLDREARRHVRALRLRDGASVRITNGRGAMWEGRLEGTADGEGTPSCRLEATRAVEPLLPVVLGFGIAAKPRTLWLVEKAVELGVAVMRPIEFARSASVADGARSPAFWTKARRRAEEALEQSGGAWLPEIRDPISLAAFLEEESEPGAADSDGPSAGLLLTPVADVELIRSLEAWNGGGRLTLLVGPEGGLEAGERNAIVQAGIRAARLGVRTLRFETAAIAAVAVAAQHFAAHERTGLGQAATSERSSG